MSAMLSSQPGKELLDPRSRYSLFWVGKKWTKQVFCEKVMPSQTNLFRMSFLLRVVNLTNGTFVGFCAVQRYQASSGLSIHTFSKILQWVSLHPIYPRNQYHPIPIFWGAMWDTDQRPEICPRISGEIGSLLYIHPTSPNRNQKKIFKM